MTDRTRPIAYINDIRLTLERGDGECIDIGPIPDLGNALAVAAFLVKLNDAVNRTGRYFFGNWKPEKLDFRYDIPPVYSHNDTEKA